MTPMTEAFLRLFAWRPQRAIAIAYWQLTRRRIRARNQLRDAVAEAPFRYTIQSRIAERSETAISSTIDLLTNWGERPTFSIIMLASRYCRPAWIGTVGRALQEQSYDRWELVIVGSATHLRRQTDPRIRYIPLPVGDEEFAFERALELIKGDFIVPLSDGVELAGTALLHFAEALRAEPKAQVLYGDEDILGRDRCRYRPWFKPLWNAEMILAIDYVSRSCAMRSEEARVCTNDKVFRVDRSAYALLLAMTKDDSVSVMHVPQVTAHVPIKTQTKGQNSRVAAVKVRISALSATAEAGPHGTVRVRWPMPDPAPEVAILIPTRDKVGLLRTCVESILELTEYDHYKIVILDNGSVEATTISYLTDICHDPRVTVMPCPMPYNFSAINNLAVAHTDVPFLCFLNNDTKVITGNWLGEMIRYAVRPGIGAVGAKLLYEDGSVQHAGVVMGLGNAAGHAHRGLPDGDVGYFAQAHAAHFASAVTAACLVVEREKFVAVGGFDAEHLQIAYNDVDMCLKLREMGWSNVYAPQAKLLHLESKSRGADLSPMHIDRYMRELAVLQARWDTLRIVDPMHHPALDRGSEIYRMDLLQKSGEFS